VVLDAVADAATPAVVTAAAASTAIDSFLNIVRM
jgi:hypothetical protein